MSKSYRGSQKFLEWEGEAQNLAQTMADCFWSCISARRLGREERTQDQAMRNYVQAQQDLYLHLRHAPEGPLVNEVWKPQSLKIQELSEQFNGGTIK